MVWVTIWLRPLPPSWPVGLLVSVRYACVDLFVAFTASVPEDGDSLQNVGIFSISTQLITTWSDQLCILLHVLYDDGSIPKSGLYWVRSATCMSAYLWSHAEHLEWRWHVKTRWDADVAEVHCECLAPHTKVADVKHCEISWQGEDYRLAVVPTQWNLFSVLVGHPDALRARSAASPNPELCIWNSTSSFQTQLVEILISVDCISLRFVMPHPQFCSLFLNKSIIV